MSIRKQKKELVASMNNTQNYVLNSAPRITRSMSMKMLVTPTSKELFLPENAKFDTNNITFSEINKNCSSTFEPPQETKKHHAENIVNEKNGNNSFEVINMTDSDIQKSPKIEPSIVEWEINRTFSPDKNGLTSAIVFDNNYDKSYSDNNSIGKDSDLINYDYDYIHSKDNRGYNKKTSTINNDICLYKECFTSQAQTKPTVKKEIQNVDIEKNEIFFETIDLACIPRPPIENIIEREIHAVFSTDKSEKESAIKCNTKGKPSDSAVFCIIPSTPLQIKSKDITASIYSIPSHFSTIKDVVTSPDMNKTFSPQINDIPNCNFDENIGHTPRKNLQWNALVISPDQDNNEIIEVANDNTLSRNLKGIRKRSLSANDVDVPKKRVTFRREVLHSSNTNLNEMKKRNDTHKNPSIKSFLPRPISSKVKIIDFAAVHKQQFNRMESIEEYVNRKEERSIKLRSFENKTPTPAKKKEIMKKTSNNDIISKYKKPKGKENDLNKKSKNLFMIEKKPIKILDKISERKEKNIRLYKNNENLKETSLSVTQRSEILKGVRSNRRFDLLMQYRNRME